MKIVLLFNNISLDYPTAEFISKIQNAKFQLPTPEKYMSSNDMNHQQINIKQEHASPQNSKLGCITSREFYKLQN